MMVEGLTPISDADLLESVKTAINLKGNDYQNDTIKFWIETVKQDLYYAGVSADVLGSTLAVGCIARGVDDYWASHRTEYSPAFYMMAERLRNTKVGYHTQNINVNLLGSVIKNHYVVAAETSILTIGIEGYEVSTDSLALYVNGLKFDSSLYAILNNDTVKLLYPLIVGTRVEFVVTKLKKGAE